MTKTLPSYTENGISGYLMEDIKAFLPPQEYKAFCDWIYGQTGMLTKDGKMLVYSCDWERFMLGLPVID